MDLFPLVTRGETTPSGGVPVLGAAGTHPAAGRRVSKSGNTDTKRSSKRMRETVELPPIRDGVISASKSPVVDEGRLVNVKTDVFSSINKHNIKHFFDGDSVFTKIEDIPKYKIADPVMALLKNTKASEEDLRNSVFGDFSKNHKIPFAPELYSEDTDQSGNTKYKEAQVNTLLGSFGKTIGFEHQNMSRIMRGLPVTTTSKPDLVPLDKRVDGNQQLWMGEFKNHEKYKEENARVQCIMYMIALLYWLRTVVGMRVESVYGFYVCGPRCSDLEKERAYTVGLLKLNAPQYFGDELNVMCLSCRETNGNAGPFQLLLHFLKKGRRWTMPDSATHRAEKPIPALFILPTNLWDDSEQRKLVLHGSLSIVFRIKALGLKELLSDGSPAYFKVSKRDIMIYTYWQTHLQELYERVDQENPTVWFYLKVRSKNASWQTRPMGAMADAWDLLTNEDAPFNILETYVTRPFVTESFGLVLMYDRGSRLRDVALSWDKKTFLEFSNICNTAMFLSQHLPHGDVLPHNLVVDPTSGKMTLIDIDEGVAKGEGADRIVQRENSYSHVDRNWFIALSYPNPLRVDASLYTKTQLLALFLMLSTRMEVPSQYAPKIDELVANAKHLGEKLFHLDRKDHLVLKKSGPDVEVKELVMKAEKDMNELCAMT